MSRPIILFFISMFSIVGCTGKQMIPKDLVSLNSPTLEIPKEPKDSKLISNLKNLASKKVLYFTYNKDTNEFKFVTLSDKQYESHIDAVSSRIDKRRLLEDYVVLTEQFWKPDITDYSFEQIDFVGKEYGATNGRQTVFSKSSYDYGSAVFMTVVTFGVLTVADAAVTASGGESVNTTYTYDPEIAMYVHKRLLNIIYRS